MGSWIEGQADRKEGQRILAALPRVHQGEGWVWAPGDGVLRLARFPRIRTLDTSATPQRLVRAGAAEGTGLPIPDLPALCETLGDLVEDTAAEVLAAMIRTGGEGSVAELAFMVRHLRKLLASTQERLGAVEGELASLRADTGSRP